MICIIDCGIGNVKSIQNMIKKVGYDSIISSDLQDISSSSFLILPGVGSFDYGINKMLDLKIYDYLKNVHATEKLLLGICLGMHFLLDSSDEGSQKGLGLIPGKVKKFESNTLSIPHMGWNKVVFKNNDILNSSEIFRFYFVHSYYADTSDDYILCKTNYSHEFASGIRYKKVFGTQFHPEKSHEYGINFFRNFIGKFYA